MNCAFCNRSDDDINARIIVENEFAYAFPTRTPIVPGHTLICPKRHVQTYNELLKEEKEAIEILRCSIRKSLKKCIKAQGFNYAWNEEKIAGQSVPHFHLHIVPRKEGDTGIYEYEPTKFLYRPGDREISPKEELIEVSKLIQANL